MDKFCKDCVHNEVCRYDAICITGHCNDKETLDDLTPKGEWIKKYKGQVNSFCSECDYEVGKITNFCPNCGAYMKKGGAEE